MCALIISSHVKIGPEREPCRSYHYAMGLTPQQIPGPLISVTSFWNEAAPCRVGLLLEGQAVRNGVSASMAQLNAVDLRQGKIL